MGRDCQLACFCLAGLALSFPRLRSSELWTAFCPPSRGADAAAVCDDGDLSARGLSTVIVCAVQRGALGYWDMVHQVGLTGDFPVLTHTSRYMLALSEDTGGFCTVSVARLSYVDPLGTWLRG